ncbi:hypothetical protein FDP22_23230 (plasmid) [Paroceanicella profunda]|uniref:Uncharacterized protein n=1 Tax=Paroceanicella profunda TaxID=2579971 RepID=A0A5B8G0Y3_9RHOB|nr:hypothetical protein [Paroceanicella profunda]QDL94786.1 hypothetical protein FDP22_23230 [Paroceanicella profunda]
MDGSGSPEDMTGDMAERLARAGLITHRIELDPNAVAGARDPGLETALLEAICERVAGQVFRLGAFSYGVQAAPEEGEEAFAAGLAEALGASAGFGAVHVEPLSPPGEPLPSLDDQALILVGALQDAARTAAGPGVRSVLDAGYAIAAARLTAGRITELVDAALSGVAERVRAIIPAPVAVPASEEGARLVERLEAIEARIGETDPQALSESVAAAIAGLDPRLAALQEALSAPSDPPVDAATLASELAAALATHFPAPDGAAETDTARVTALAEALAPLLTASLPAGPDTDALSETLGTRLDAALAALPAPAEPMAPEALAEALTAALLPALTASLPAGPDADALSEALGARLDAALAALPAPAEPMAPEALAEALTAALLPALTASLPAGPDADALSEALGARLDAALAALPAPAEPMAPEALAEALTAALLPALTASLPAGPDADALSEALGARLDAALAALPGPAEPMAPEALAEALASTLGPTLAATLAPALVAALPPAPDSEALAGLLTARVEAAVAEALPAPAEPADPETLTRTLAEALADSLSARLAAELAPAVIAALPPAPPSLSEGVARRLDAIETHLAALAQPSGQEDAGRLAASLRDTQRRLDTHAAELEESLSRLLAREEDRQSRTVDLDERLGVIEHALMRFGDAAISRRSDPPLSEKAMARHVEVMQSRLTALTERIEALAARPLPEAPDLAALKQDLATGFEEGLGRLGALTAQATPDPVDLAPLEIRLETLSAQLSDALSGLAPGVAAELASPLAALGREISTLASALPPPPDLDSLRTALAEEIRAGQAEAEARLEPLSTRIMALPVSAEDTLEPLTRRIDRMQKTLQSLATRAAVVGQSIGPERARLQGIVLSLQAVAEHLQTGGGEEGRGAAPDLSGLEETLARLDSRLESLADSFATAAAAAPAAGGSDTFAEGLARVEARFDGLAEELAGARPAPGEDTTASVEAALARFETRLDGLARALADTAPAEGGDPEALAAALAPALAAALGPSAEAPSAAQDIARMETRFFGEIGNLRLMLGGMRTALNELGRVTAPPPDPELRARLDQISFILSEYLSRLQPGGEGLPRRVVTGAPGPAASPDPAPAGTD